MRREEALPARLEAGPEGRRYDGSRQHLWRGPLFQCGQGVWGQADSGLRALRVQGRGPSRGDAKRPVQSPAGGGRKRRGLPQSDSTDERSEPARLLSQAAREQEVSCGKFEGVDWFLRLPERRVVRRADGWPL